MKFPMTTLCYIEKDGCYLLLHRVKKQDDVNKDKWIGVGGHFEPGESPEDCLVREVKEETGLTLNSWRFCGIVTFVSHEDGKDDFYEFMCLYESSDFSGSLIECDEGNLEWVRKEDLEKLNFWEGDYVFLDLMEKKVPFFSLKLVYRNGILVESTVN